MTLVATFLATVPAVFIGIWAERRLERRRERTEANESFQTIIEPGSVVYDTRDWARSLLTSVETAEPVRLPLSVGSAESLNILVSIGAVPESLRSDVLSLARHVARLHELVDQFIGTKIPSTHLAMVEAEAKFVQGLSSRLVARGQKEATP